MHKSKFFVTTPIYYINDQPHIGHAYSTIVADVLARYHRGKGDEVLFSTGVDENGQKTVEAATKQEMDTAAYADKASAMWQQTWKDLGISFDRFIRTTEPGHREAVYAFIKPVLEKGDLYKSQYEGLYCVGHEAFMREDELVDGKCPEHNRAPEKVQEENYFFRLSKYQQPLLEYIKSHPEFVQPESRRNEVRAFIERGLQDFSVSRAHKQWGIPWPNDKDQTIYVWFDALANYLTVTGYPKKGYDKWWPADVHVVGKDITKFHCIYWPAMLMSAGLPLPKQVFAHGFFTVEGKKISKSLGNAIDPQQLAGDFGVEALRYYLLREIPYAADGEFTQQRFEQVYNTDLANDLGNLVQRVAVMITKYFGGEIADIPAHSHDAKAYHQAVEEFRFDRALGEVWELVRGLNQFIEEEQPWKLGDDRENLHRVLAHAVSDLVLIASLLIPFMPQTAEKIFSTFANGKVDQSVGLLFPKTDTIEKTSF